MRRAEEDYPVPDGLIGASAHDGVPRAGYLILPAHYDAAMAELNGWREAGEVWREIARQHTEFFAGAFTPFVKALTVSVQHGIAMLERAIGTIETPEPLAFTCQGGSTPCVPPPCPPLETVEVYAVTNTPNRHGDDRPD